MRAGQIRGLYTDDGKVASIRGSSVEKEEEEKGCFDAANAFEVSDGGSGAVFHSAVFHVTDG